ncbi:hypothetical protein BRD00_03755 [Halobacteriales archaeon QS_8_69_26]|nr:MAG: hypothetical protein BRD00_03755 [Halobacteriales archaeon QS_8_69_26]
MGSDVQVPVTYATARAMATVAAEASEMTAGGLLSTTHKGVLEVVSRRMVDELTPGRVAGLFAVRDGDTVIAEIGLDPSTVEAYLKTLDLVAVQTPRPYVRASCQRLCSHLVENADAIELGLRPEDYEAVDIRAGRVSR